MDTTTQINQQDWLRGVRGFINTMAGVVNDQSWSGQDGRAFNSPYGYQTVGPSGIAIEGAPISITPAGGVAVSNGTLMLILGAAAVFLLRR